MKKLKILISTLLMGIIVFALAACGGAGGTLSSFVRAVKQANFEKAATYVVGNIALENPAEGDGEIYQYIFSKAAKSFSYKIEEETMNEAETSCTLKISYNGYSGTSITIQYLAKLATGSEATKATVNEVVKGMQKKSGNRTVNLVKNNEGDWEIAALSATALVLAIYG